MASAEATRAATARIENFILDVVLKMKRDEKNWFYMQSLLNYEERRQLEKNFFQRYFP